MPFGYSLTRVRRAAQDGRVDKRLQLPGPKEKRGSEMSEVITAPFLGITLAGTLTTMAVVLCGFHVHLSAQVASVGAPQRAPVAQDPATNLPANPNEPTVMINGRLHKYVDARSGVGIGGRVLVSMGCYFSWE